MEGVAGSIVPPSQSCETRSNRWFSRLPLPTLPLSPYHHPWIQFNCRKKTQSIKMNIIGTSELRKNLSTDTQLMFRTTPEVELEFKFSKTARPVSILFRTSRIDPITDQSYPMPQQQPSGDLFSQSGYRETFDSGKSGSSPLRRFPFHKKAPSESNKTCLVLSLRLEVDRSIVADYHVV